MEKIQFTIPQVRCRIAIIEIGSKSIRLKIHDVTDEGLKYVYSDSEFILPGSIVSKPLNIVHKKLDEIREYVKAYRAIAEDKKADIIEVFGTEVLRNLIDEHQDILQKILPDAKALDGRSEALCGLISAIKSLPSKINLDDEMLLIDQGSGSVQIARGRLVKDGIELEESTSYPLGTNVLFQILEESGDSILNGKLAMFMSQLDANLIQLDSNPQTCEGLITVVTGSVATKAVWLREKLSLIEQENKHSYGQSSKFLEINYDRNRVHEQTYTTREITPDITMLLTAVRQDEKETRKFVSPENPNGRTLEEQVVGLITLKKLLDKRQVNSFIVSTEGINVGITWALASASKILSYYRA